MEENILRPRYQIDEPESLGPSRRFFRTAEGPGATAYPTAPASVYYVKWLRNVSYTETPGNQSLAATQTEFDGYVYNLAEPGGGENDYIPLATVGLAFKLGTQWFTNHARLQIVEGVLDAALSPASSAKDGPATATLSIWTPDGGGEFADSGDNVTITSRMTEHPEIAAGTWLVALRHNGEFRPIAADCAPTTVT